VLRDVNLEVQRGTVLAILGASGVGKSTLLNILGTLDRPESGTLELAGERIDTLNDRGLARLRATRLGFIFQFHCLLPEFTAEENVMMPLLIAGVGASAARERAREALLLAGLEERWQHFPAELSGGEAQRVAVARALAPKPELVLADEPSGNLDSASAGVLHDVITSLSHQHGQTFVVVTHNDRLADRADRVLRLENGRLTAH
jgi:lipoprotein-releasing system ATP-binding protein